MPRANTEAVNEHFVESGEAVAPRAYAALVLVGTRQHISGTLAVPADIGLARLPPYAPELDFIEHGQARP